MSGNGNGWLWKVVISILVPLVFGGFVYTHSVEKKQIKERDLDRVEQSVRDLKEEIRTRDARILGKLDCLINPAMCREITPR